MSSWGKTDASASRPLWAEMLIKRAPNNSGSPLLFQNASANAFISGQTIGLFNYTTSETQSGKIAHTGWVLKTTGSGGRAGRVQYDTLVCLTSNT